MLSLRKNGMKIRLSAIVFLMLSCNPPAMKNGDKLKTICETTEIEATEFPETVKANAEIIETFTDSLNIGRKGKCKIELIKHRVFDDHFIIIKFYIKSPTSWYIQNTYSYETDALMGFEPNISNFNGDNYNDLTFISGTAARGANEVRRLFIYDDQQQKLVSIVNSQEYPNMLYNKELNCIDAWIVTGTTMTVFAKIIGDSLKTFASVDNSEGYHTIYVKNGTFKELYKVKSFDELFLKTEDMTPIL